MNVIFSIDKCYKLFWFTVALNKICELKQGMDLFTYTCFCVCSLDKNSDSHFACQGPYLAFLINNLVTRWFAWTHAHWVSECKKLLIQWENLFVWHDQTGFSWVVHFSVCSLVWNTGKVCCTWYSTILHLNLYVSTPEPVSCDTGQRITYFDSCQLITTWMCKLLGNLVPNAPLTKKP